MMFSKGFKIALIALFFVYVGAWAYTIHLAQVQQTRGFQVILPVVPQDSEEYRNLSEALLEGKGFSQHGITDTLRSPGYPFFLAISKLVTGSYFAVTFLQILLVFFSAIIIKRLGAFFYSNKAGEIAAFVFLLSPLTLTLSLIILTDILFLSLFLFAFYISLFAHKKLSHLILASLLFAAAIYVRPMGVFALPIFALPFLVSDSSLKQKIKSVIVMLFIVIIAVLPWVYRNYKLTGVADFTSFKAINLAAYAVPLYLANQNHTSQLDEMIKIEKLSGVPRENWKDLRYSKKVSLTAEKIILEHPFSYLKFHITSSLPFLVSSSIQDTIVTYQHAMHIEGEYNNPGAIKYLTSHDWKLFFESITGVWWKICERILWLLIYLIAAFGLFINRKDLLAWAFVFIPLYLMILAGPAAGARYALQGLPFILILFSVGFLEIKNKILKKHV